MAALFTPDGRYQDFAFEVVFDGRDAVASWVDITGDGVRDVRVEVEEVFADGDRTAVRWTFSGHLVGAPRAFSVPVLTVIETTRSARIAYLGDYYNRADVLAQSGLPLDTTFS